MSCRECRPPERPGALNISAAGEGGYIVTSAMVPWIGRREGDYMGPAAALFAGSLQECLDYIGDAFDPMRAAG